MQKPTRTILALAAGSLVLGLVGAGTAVADEDPMADTPSQGVVADEPENDQSGADHDGKYTVGKVVSHGPLLLRSWPSTHSRPVGQVKPRDKVAIVCKVHGEWVDGNDLWYRLHLKEEHGQRPGDEKEEHGQRPHDEKKEHGQRPHDEKESSDESLGGDDRSGKEEKKVWVAARYVKNQDHVNWCD